MYRGFKLNYEVTNTDYYNAGNAIFTSHTSQARSSLNKYITKGGLLDGNIMEEDWFPEVDADIFISHSHGNTTNAITLAGWLHEEFGLNAFIDSCVWGYAGNLLLKLDNEYSKTDEKGVYYYRKTNLASSHVHMMLSSALGKMIDKCECLFFLNTPTFITSQEVISQETESPWIYAEIAMSRIVRRTIPLRRNILLNETKLFSKGGLINDNLRIKYHMNMDHLAKLTQLTLNAWAKKWPTSPSQNALDDLYELMPFDNDNLLEK